MIGPRTLIRTLEVRGVKLRASGPLFDHLKVLFNKGDISRQEKKLIEKYKPEILQILREREAYKFLADNIDSIIHGDSEDVLKKFPANSFDMLAIDPNYGIGFMGKEWDKSVPEIKLFEQCLRVLKPGAFAFFMCSPRQDVLAQMITNLKQAGFLVNFPSIYWTYASGFPKIHNISKAVDKKNGAKGKVVGIKKNKINFSNSRKGDASFYNAAWQNGNYTDLEVTVPETDQAKALEGAYAGFQPKPAVEVILVVMKPLAEKSYTEQALANGKGCTWLDDCRIPYADENIPSRDLIKQKSSTSNQVIASQGDEWHGNQVGRMPANLLVSDNVLDDGKNHKGGGIGGWPKLPEGKCGFGFKPLGDKAPVRPNDEGGYSRFFSLDAWADRNLPFLNVPKASKAEKNAGLDGFPEQTVSDGRKTPNDTAFQRDVTPRKNIHPTVKPVKLMAYLIAMGSRPGDLIGDFAAGSGTTGLAAKLLGRKFIGIEKEEEYHRIAVARVENASQDVPVLKRAVADIRKHDESREQQEDDTRTCQVSNEENSRFQVLDLFSGIGGFSLGLEKAGFRTVAFCEIDDFARKVLSQHWPGVPIYEDIKELNYERLKSDGISPDVLVGGFPCTDISIAGKKAGIEGEQSGLWKEFKRLIAEINPQWVIIENVANLRSNGLVTVLQDLREIGFDAEWHIIPASAVGAPHQRERIWIVAYPGCQHGEKGPEIFSRLQGQLKERDPFGELERSGSPQDRIVKGSTCTCGMADGFPKGLDKLRLKALGNAVVPQIPELIGKAILESLR